MNRYKSEKDVFFFTLNWAIIIALLIMVWMGLSAGGSLLFIPVWLLILMFVVSTWYMTNYEIENGHLRVRSGPLNWNIPIDRIEKIRRKRSLSSGPAHSRDRLEIVYAGGSLLVSPVREDEFLKQLTSLNRKIAVEVPDAKKTPAK
ncbi:PH domain-containing protein [Saccharibacillus alkalitolerans]|uniref:PH domain-containing protein n=1 Tax=Saccharibacillus alkalitolerans TaxID=2705290 RepID=A0ABX0F030_9BACL|nr:PH domain-containing protein [Saccharibacillus alkalitolerans]NGZ74348.1 PH domain-containing protein [Saccharibacillus alkalitolerans]